MNKEAAVTDREHNTLQSLSLHIYLLFKSTFECSFVDLLVRDEAIRYTCYLFLSQIKKKDLSAQEAFLFFFILQIPGENVSKLI